MNDSETSDLSDEEDVSLYIELSGVLHDSLLESSGADFKLIGIESDKPILQIADQIFEGHFEEVFGTALLFEEVNAHKIVLPEFSKREKFVYNDKGDSKALKYYSKCGRKLVMKKVLVTPNQGGATSLSESFVEVEDPLLSTDELNVVDINPEEVYLKSGSLLTEPAERTHSNKDIAVAGGNCENLPEGETLEVEEMDVDA